MSPKQTGGTLMNFLNQQHQCWRMYEVQRVLIVHLAPYKHLTVCVCTRACAWPNQTNLQISVISRLCHNLCLLSSRGVANTCPDLELLSSLMDTAERARSDGIKFFGGLKNFQTQQYNTKEMFKKKRITDQNQTKPKT